MLAKAKVKSVPTPKLGSVGGLPGGIPPLTGLASILHVPLSPQGARAAAVLSAVILAACVAAAGAVAPSEEWAERFRLLEARFELSEQNRGRRH